jgi:hypothetical protein
MSNVNYILGGVFSLKRKEKTNICQVKDDFLEVSLSNQNANKKKYKDSSLKRLALSALFKSTTEMDEYVGVDMNWERVSHWYTGTIHITFRVKKKS